mmetsp:Transcript_28661/g.34909  ORF Transcript_28661/g.34909 Transcript_28661/m.34909 type:complete len:93 (+) Transcript_28661:511-789(+)
MVKGNCCVVVEGERNWPLSLVGSINSGCSPVRGNDVDWDVAKHCDGFGIIDSWRERSCRIVVGTFFISSQNSELGKNLCFYCFVSFGSMGVV